MDKKISIYFYQLFSQKKKLGKISDFLCLTLPPVIMLLYFSTALTLFIKHDSRLKLILLVPALTLFIVTIIRKIINRPRPFETIPGLTLRTKHQCGESFPSRHTSSAFIIAFALTTISVPIGVLSFVLAVVIGATRIFTGLHYPSDILAGASISIIMGFLFFL